MTRQEHITAILEGYKSHDITLSKQTIEYLKGESDFDIRYHLGNMRLINSNQMLIMQREKYIINVFKFDNGEYQLGITENPFDENDGYYGRDTLEGLFEDSSDILKLDRHTQCEIGYKAARLKCI